MLDRLKSLFKGPEPAGLPETLRTFSAGEPTISRDGVEPESDGWRIDCPDARTVQLFEVTDPGAENCLLTYRARMKTERAQGRTYLEMWCRLPGRGEFFSKGFHNALKGSTDWASCETPFFLRKEQRPDLVKLNLVAEGPATVWIKDVELLKTTLK
jgi:hypothetical protein